ncbi:MAG: DUF1727 domain-containing protein [Candidatus Levybacteria bacterium]|nr:DUF1727 domain-containing protein [Candidatus Levybacteria bacterium]
MINNFLIFLGKTLSNLSLTLNLGSGSTWPGHLALKTNKHFIQDLLKNSHIKVILIVGTNGKTTTSTLIQHILEKSGKKVFQNVTGANLLNGIASTLLLNTNRYGQLDADYAIFEVDENALPKLLKEITPDTLIALNLFRDQLDRYGEVNSIVTNWAKALKDLPSTTTLILNADDPEIAYLGLRCHPEQREGSNMKDSSTKSQNDNVKYFGLDDTKLGLTSFQHASDSLYCPKCREKLTYKTRYFSHLGDWSCPKCGLKRPKLSLATSSSYPLSGIYNMYNTNAAVLFAKNNNISNEAIEQSLKDFKPAFGRQESLTYYGKNIQLFLSKNPTSLNQSLRTIRELKGKYLLLLLNDRGPDGHDVSWIWDVDFEDYITPDMHIFISGDRCYDMGLRIKYTKQVTITNYELRIEENLQKAIDEAVTAMPKDQTLYILPTYSAMLDTRKILTGKKIL